jgi:sulfite exporter TauE/SafE
MNIVNGLLLGLSTGVFCTAYCTPVFLPQLLSEKEKLRGWGVFFKFNLGRLVAYAIFGAVFGWLGSEFHQEWLGTVTRWIMIGLAAILIMYGLGLTLPKLTWCAWTRKAQVPIISGFLIGINICPPFLLALSYNFQAGGILNGIIFFLLFFIGTTIYLIPVTFFGLLAGKKWIRQAGRLAAIIVGVVFLVLNI